MSGPVGQTSVPIYQKLLSRTLWEGVRVMRAAGYGEYGIAGIPSFALLRLWAMPPGWMSRPLFKRRLRGYEMGSMTQDVFLRGAQDTELESIIGYVVQLATEHGLPAPYNSAIYRLGRENFHSGFKPLSCEAVLAAVERERALSENQGVHE
jgi:ketopantoate reductase